MDFSIIKKWLVSEINQDFGLKLKYSRVEHQLALPIWLHVASKTSRSIVLLHMLIRTKLNHFLSYSISNLQEVPLLVLLFVETWEVLTRIWSGRLFPLSVRTYQPRIYPKQLFYLNKVGIRLRTNQFFQTPLIGLYWIYRYCNQNMLLTISQVTCHRQRKFKATLSRHNLCLIITDLLNQIKIIVLQA